MEPIRTTGYAAALILAASLTAATTAYVPVCCNSNSTVSVIGTAQNKLGGNFSAGPGSYAVTFPKPGTAWVTNAGNRTISIVSLATGTVKQTIQLKLQPWLIKTSPDGARVYVVTGMFTGSLQHYSSRLQAYDAQTGADLGYVKLPNDGLANPGLAISPDSSLVYATFDSQTIVVYNVVSGTTSATWKTTRALTWTATGTLTLSPDGKTLYTAGQVLTAIDTASGTVAGTVNPPGPSRTYSFVGSAITADGGTLYASYAAQIGTGAGLAVINTASLAITSTARLGSELQQPVLSKDGATLYVPDAIDSLLYVVNAANLTVEKPIALTGPIATATLSADGGHLYVPNSSTATALAVDTASLTVTAAIGISGTANPQIGLTGPTGAASTANGGSVFVAGIESNSISEISVATNKVAHTFTAGAQSPSVAGVNPPAILVTPNGQQIYTAGSDFQPELTEIDTATGAVNGIACTIGFGCEVTTMAALPDSSRVYLAGAGSSINTNPPFLYVVDTATKKVIASPKVNFIPAAMVASPSGAFLYLTMGSAIAIFDTAQNAFTSSLPVAANALAFSPDGATLYAVNGSTLQAVDVATGQVIGSVDLGGAASAISVSPDGTQVWAALTKSTNVVVVNTQNNTPVTLNLGFPVSAVAFGVQ